VRALALRAGIDRRSGGGHRSGTWKLPDDAVTDPRELCGAQPVVFVRPCWYRAFVDNRPAGVQVRTAVDLDTLCSGLDGLQREACMTAASVIGPPDPAVQLELCAGLADRADAESCVRGTKVQNLFGYPIAVPHSPTRRASTDGRGGFATRCSQSAANGLESASGLVSGAKEKA
jgi:hypothetical protein